MNYYSNANIIELYFADICEDSLALLCKRYKLREEELQGTCVFQSSKQVLRNDSLFLIDLKECKDLVKIGGMRRKTKYKLQFTHRRIWCFLCKPTHSFLSFSIFPHSLCCFCNNSFFVFYRFWLALCIQKRMGVEYYLNVV